MSIVAWSGRCFFTPAAARRFLSFYERLPELMASWYSKGCAQGLVRQGQGNPRCCWRNASLQRYLAWIAGGGIAGHGLMAVRLPSLRGTGANAVECGHCSWALMLMNRPVFDCPYGTSSG